jgi:hypothetical protein
VVAFDYDSAISLLQPEPERLFHEDPMPALPDGETDESESKEIENAEECKYIGADQRIDQRDD